MIDRPLKIHVFSKIRFHEVMNENNINDDNIDGFKDLALICIHDTSGDFYHNPYFVGSHNNVLNLFFDDVEKDSEFSPTNMSKNTRAFTSVDAKKIIKFLNDNKKMTTLIVHCAGGISRSGAVGRFALDYFKGDKDFFKLNNFQICPNARVSMLLNKEMR
jgi:predicted protein tyrosine phosphatase